MKSHDTMKIVAHHEGRHDHVAGADSVMQSDPPAGFLRQGHNREVSTAWTRPTTAHPRTVPPQEGAGARLQQSLLLLDHHRPTVLLAIVVLARTLNGRPPRALLLLTTGTE